MKIFEFIFSDCIYEGASATISLHRTKEGAEKALKKHKLKEKKDFNSLYKKGSDFFEFKGDMKFDDTKYWGIVETELLD